MNDYKVKVLKTIDELTSVRDFWKDQAIDPNADFDFFVNHTLGSRTSVASPYVLAVWDGSSLKALLLAYRCKGPLEFKISYKSLYKTQVETLTVPTGGLIGDDSPAVVNELVSVMRRAMKKGEFEVLIVGHVSQDSTLLQKVRTSVPWICMDHTFEYERHWKGTLAPSLEEFLASLKGDFRKKLRWQNKQLEKNHPTVRMHCFRETAELEKLCVDVEQIAEGTYQRSLGASFVNDGVTRKRIAFEAENRWLRMYVLYVDDKPVAYWWGRLYRGVFHSEAMGFDVQYKRYSPGIYLLTQAIGTLCSEGVQSLDFGSGDFLYKRQFGSGHWFETPVFYVFAPKLRPMGFSLMRNSLGFVRSSARRLLSKSSLLDRIRETWLGQLSKTPRQELK